MNNKKISLKKNYIYNLIYQFLLIIVPIITTPYISRVLNPDGIGIYSYTFSIVTYFTMFATLGVALYGQLEIAEHRDNKEQRSKLFWEIFTARLITSTIVTIIYIIFTLLTPKYNSMYMVLIINILASMIDIAWYFQGIEQFKITVTRNIIIKLICTILIFLLVKKPSDLILYALIVQGSSFLGNISLWAYIKNEIIFTKFKDLKFYRHWKKSIIYFIPTFATSIYTVLDKSMIGWITKSEFQNGYYEQAHKIEQTLVAIITSLAIVTMPRIRYLIKNNKEEAKKIVNNAMTFIMFISIPMSFGLFIEADYLVPWFLGNNYSDSIIILKIFSILIFLVGMDNTIGKQCLMATNNQNKFNIGVIVGAIVNFITNIVLIPKFQALGAAIASVLAEFVILVIFIIFSKKMLDIKRLVLNFIKYSIYSIIMIGVSLLVIKYIHTSNMLNMLIIFVTSLFTYLFLLFVTKDKMLNTIKKSLKSKRKKIN